jgi:hypothetical protein
MRRTGRPGNDSERGDWGTIGDIDKLDGLGDTNVNDELDHATDEPDEVGDTNVDEELDQDDANGMDGIDEQDGMDGVDERDGMDGVDERDSMDGVNERGGMDGVNERGGMDGPDGVDGWNGVDDLETVRSQSRFSPDGLFRTVGRTPWSSLKAFVRLRAL